MSNSRSVPFTMLRDLLQPAILRGVDLSTILAGAGLQQSDLADRHRRLPLTAYGPLLSALWLQMDDESGGVLERPLPCGTFAMMAYASLSSDSIREGLQRSVHFLGLLADGFKLTLGEEGDRASLQLELSSPLSIDTLYPVLSWFVVLIRWNSWLANRPLLLQRVDFKSVAPAYVAEFPMMFPCQVHFQQRRNQIFFDRAILDMQPCRSNSEAKRFLKSAPQSLLTRFRDDVSLAGQIQMLLQRNETGRVDFNDVACSLNSTTHTLRRRLHREGTSFKLIKERVLRERAEWLLIKSDKSIAEIALTIGYSEPAAFNHAFKNWTGLSPGRFRQRFSTL